MAYHIALSRPFDLAGINQEAQQGKRPRHTMWDLSQKLGAIVHQPENHPISLLDRLSARLVGQPEHWAMARVMVSKLADDDVVFCAGEDIGFPLAILCKFAQKTPKLAVAVMAPDRPRVRAVSKLFGLGHSISLFITNTQLKAMALRQHLNLAGDRVYQLPEQTDVKFFNPGAVSPTKQRPIIASAGLEQRDYQTLADATRDLDVDVRICAVSPNASAKTRVAFPDPVPSNMEARHYDWHDLLQLYRDADIVAVSLLDNHYSAGLTTLMEAMACRKPVVMTRTSGLAEELIDRGVVRGVQPGDAAGMQRAIAELLSDPQQAETLAQRGYEVLLQEHTSERQIEELAEKLTHLVSQRADEQINASAIQFRQI